MKCDCPLNVSNCSCVSGLYVPGKVEVDGMFVDSDELLQVVEVGLPVTNGVLVAFIKSCNDMGLDDIGKVLEGMMRQFVVDTGLRDDYVRVVDSILRRRSHKNPYYKKNH